MKKFSTFIKLSEVAEPIPTGEKKFKSLHDPKKTDYVVKNADGKPFTSGKKDTSKSSVNASNVEPDRKSSITEGNSTHSHSDQESVTAHEYSHPDPDYRGVVTAHTLKSGKKVYGHETFKKHNGSETSLGSVVGYESEKEAHDKISLHGFTKKKAVKEEVQLQELSKKTAKSYLEKSAERNDKIQHTADGYSSAAKKAANKLPGIANAEKRSRVKMREEVEPLEELSKKTLSNYTRKAAFKMADKSEDLVNASSTEERSKARKAITKKAVGISRATSRLTKEEVEPLQELSSNTLKKYVIKAKSETGGSSRKSENRRYNISLAREKLAKKPVFKQGKADAKTDDRLGNAYRTQHALAGRRPHYEEVEPLQELSTTTLKSYSQKTNKQLLKHINASDRESAEVENGDHPNVKSFKDLHDMPAHKKLNNRTSGKELARTKMKTNKTSSSVKEETDLQELSSQTLRSYTRGAEKEIQKPYKPDGKFSQRSAGSWVARRKIREKAKASGS